MSTVPETRKSINIIWKAVDMRESNGADAVLYIDSQGQDVQSEIHRDALDWKLSRIPFLKWQLRYHLSCAKISRPLCISGLVYLELQSQPTP
jgi:hypothetical protein